MKVGDVLTAKNVCKMRNTEETTLTIGKKYVIEGLDSKQLHITDDNNNAHFFNIKGNDGVEKYFNTKFFYQIGKRHIIY